MCKWLVFTSFRSGEHNLIGYEDGNLVLSLIKLMIRPFVLSNRSTTATQKYEIVNWNSIEEIEERLGTMNEGENIWIEFDDTTWMTIQKTQDD